MLQWLHLHKNVEDSVYYLALKIKYRIHVNFKNILIKQERQISMHLKISITHKNSIQAINTNCRNIFKKRKF